MNRDRRLHWIKTRRLTLVLLFVWLILTFGLNWFAREVNEFVFLGFSVGFYMGAQGSLLIYLLIILLYNYRMRRLDRRFGIEDE